MEALRTRRERNGPAARSGHVRARAATPGARGLAFLRAAAVALVAGLCATTALAADLLPMLFAPAPSLTQGSVARYPNPAEPAVARQRPVVVDFAYLDPRSADAPARLGVELFDGLVVALDRARIETRGPGNYTWYGQVQGFARSEVALTVVAGYIAGSITIVDAAAGLSAVFEVQSVPGGAQVLRELDSGRFPPDHPPGPGALAPPGSAGIAAAHDHAADEILPKELAADTGATIDVMVVYSNQTATAAGAGIGAQIQQAVDRANLAYANSNITPRLRLVHYAPANYDESGDFNTDLDRLTNTADGYMDGVHALRDAYGADLVSIFIENGAYCGLGWLVSSAAYGFTAVNRGCAAGNLSFAHELGHNIGARHDPYVDSSNSPYAYGHGYVYVTGLWRTVMAYNNACSDVGKSCTRVANFSNPDINYSGAPTGTAATHDNARVHDERANTVANFRQAVAVGAPSVATGAATAIATTGATLNGTVSSNGSATTVTFQYGLTVGYGSTATAAQSPLAAGASGLAVSAAITGLACNTLYHFRAVGANGNGTTNGSDATFTTAACPATPPTVATGAATVVAATGATLNGTVTSNGAATTVTFQYGLTTGYGSTAAAAQSPLAASATGSAVSAAITGLACNTLYHFRAVGSNTAGPGNGLDATFTTAACAGVAPTATTGAASAVATTGATLNGTVTSNGATTTVTFQYGSTASYGSTATAAQSPLAAGASGAPVTATIAGLACNTPYHFRVVAASTGGTTQGSDATFTTAACAGTPSTTTLASNANPSVSGGAVTFTATVTGSAPTGGVAFLDSGVALAGCGAATLSGSGNTRTATCTTSALAIGTHPVTASYAGDGANAPSASAPLQQQVAATAPITGTFVANPYGTPSVQGGTLVGNDITITASVATIQLGGVAGAPGSYAQVDFQGMDVGPGRVLNIRSGAPGQTLVMRNVPAAGTAIAGALVAQGGSGAPPPELYVHNPGGISIAASGSVSAPSGLSLDALGATWTTGASLTHAGTVDGGPYLDLYGANIQGGGLFRGNAIGLHTFGNANNPVNGAWFLQNGLQLAPSGSAGVALTLNAYGSVPQVVNLAVTGNATVWMPSAWPAGSPLPPNNAVVAPGAQRASGVPDPAYGGGSLIVQATGAMALVDGASHDFAFPGGIVLKAGGSLDVNGVMLNQGWTTSGKPFQGIYLESPTIWSRSGNLRIYGNDVNWVNFSTLPTAPVRAFVLARNPDGSASFVASDATSPHVNAYSTLSNSAASGGCWTCLVNTTPVNVYDTP